MLAPEIAFFCSEPSFVNPYYVKSLIKFQFVDIPLLAAATAIEYKSQHFVEYDSAYIPFGPEFSASTIYDHMISALNKEVFMRFSFTNQHC